MSYETLKLEVRGKIARLTMSRPEKRNPFDALAARELSRALDEAEADAAARVLVLTGEGSCFSAGGDVKAFRDSSPEENRALVEPVISLSTRFFAFGKPTIARVNGPALGGGAGLVSLCDFAIASEQSQIGYPEITLGIIPATVAVLLARLVPRRVAADLLFRGKRLSAAQAAALHIVSEAVPAAQLDERVDELASELAALSPTALKHLKAAFYAQGDLPYEQALRFSVDRFVSLMGSDDAKEGLSAFLEKRKPRWKGR